MYYVISGRTVLLYWSTVLCVVCTHCSYDDSSSRFTAGRSISCDSAVPANQRGASLVSTDQLNLSVANYLAIITVQLHIQNAVCFVLDFLVGLILTGLKHRFRQWRCIP